MSYPTITTFLHSKRGIAAAFEASIALSRERNAHLHVIAPGIDSIDTGYYFAGVHALAIGESRERACAEAKALETLSHDRLSAETIRWDIDSRVVQSPALCDYVAQRTRFCDLVVLDAPYGGRSEQQQEVTVLEAALFRSRIPVLMTPKSVPPDFAPRKVLIGWNESDEALRAIRCGLPFLHDADEANVVIINPPRHAKGRSDPGGALATYLVRHGISTEISVLARTEDDVADILIRRAREFGADMVVMGAYGHTRMREAIIGGTTRHMLERATLPVFLAH